MFDCLNSQGARLAILSDGRSVTQRLKINALGLGSIPIFLSEDYQSVKPGVERFLAIEQEWPGSRYVYVADNPVKDFVSPRARGWLTIGARWISPRVHPFPANVGPAYQPHFWLESPLEVLLMISCL